MENTETATQPAVERLGPQEVSAAQELVAESGWNQVPADWDLFLRRGEVFKVSCADGSLAATAAILPFAPRFGWISMVLVRKTHRRQGLATLLLSHCIAQLQSRGLVPVLDATPAGRTVYAPLGFQDGWSITRWRRKAAAAAMQAPERGTVRPLRDADWPDLLAIDLQAFGADRGDILHALAGRSREFACAVEREGRAAGYLLGRRGRQATQIGPVIAATPDDARALLAHALSRIEGEVLLDALDAHTDFTACLPPAGFAVERGYVRMTLDASPDAFGSAGLTAAIAGPELG